MSNEAFARVKIGGGPGTGHEGILSAGDRMLAQRPIGK